MTILSLQQILILHALVISKTGGSDGLRDIGRLESAVASQSQIVFGEELYPDLFTKAAALARGIVGDHPFVDGNKRTAILSATTLLELNDKKLVAEQGEIEDFAVKIATNKLDIDTIAAWLRSHTN